MDLKPTVDGLEKERDFYFSKLRDIELICQEHESENSPIISGIIGILYATEVSEVCEQLLITISRELVWGLLINVCSMSHVPCMHG